MIEQTLSWLCLGFLLHIRTSFGLIFTIPGSGPGIFKLFIRHGADLMICSGDNLSWLCYRGLCLGKRPTRNDGLVIENSTVSHCLSQRKSPRCRIRISPAILIVVLGANLLKALCILLTLKQTNYGLMTVGEGVSSFLQHPDANVTAFSSLSTKDFRKRSWHERRAVAEWRARIQRRHEALTVRQKVGAYFLYVSTILTHTNDSPRALAT